MMFKPRPKGLGAANFLKLADGEEVTGVFRGEPRTFRNHWMGKGSPSVECSGSDCPVCASKPEKGPAFRFRVNFITTKDGQWVAKIWEGGGDVYDMLSNLSRKFDLTKTTIEISRSGKEKNTRYNILPRADIALTPEMEAKIKAVQLHALSATESETPTS